MIRFLFIGSGARKDAVVQQVGEMGLANVVFKPFQPRTRLSLSLTVPDLHIITLKPELSGLLVPSKIYGVLAAGRPVLFIGPEDSEIARVIKDYECGFVCDCVTATEIVKIIRLLRDDQDLRVRLGNNARRAVDERYSKAKALQSWRDTLDAAIN
jgi:glycosyltransferase involved in cell wall biosynthesis